MVINDVVRFVEFLKKKGRIGNVSKQEIMDCLHRAQIDYFKFIYGLPERYQLGRPVPPVNYEATQKLMDATSRFKTLIKSSDGSMTYNSSTGIITLPANYLHLTDLYYISGTSRTTISVQEDARFIQRLTRKTATVQNNPIARFIGQTIHIEPKGLTNLEALYLRTPNKPVWGFTLSGDRQVFDAGTSTDLEWSEVHVNDIVYRALVMMGVALEDNWQIQFGTQRKNEA